MTVILYSLKNFTRVRLEHVEQIEAYQNKYQGRMTNLWCFMFEDGTFKNYPQKHFLIDTIYKEG